MGRPNRFYTLQKGSQWYVTVVRLAWSDRDRITEATEMGGCIVRLI
jgi:hypothetical protein